MAPPVKFIISDLAVFTDIFKVLVESTLKINPRSDIQFSFHIIKPW